MDSRSGRSQTPPAVKEIGNGCVSLARDWRGCFHYTTAKAIHGPAYKANLDTSSGAGSHQSSVRGDNELQDPKLSQLVRLGVGCAAPNPHRGGESSSSLIEGAELCINRLLRYFGID